MPLTDIECPNCPHPVHTDGLLDAEHHLGCGEVFPPEVYEDVNSFYLPNEVPDEWDLEEENHV